MIRRLSQLLTRHPSGKSQLTVKSTRPASSSFSQRNEHIMTDADAVQAELQDYLKSKGINELFINVVEALLLTKPENPIQFICDHLADTYPDKVRRGSMSGGVDPATGLGVDAHSEESMSEEDDDDIVELPEFNKTKQEGRRVSVSAESVDPAKLSENFQRVVHPKTPEEEQRIREILSRNVLFQALGEEQVKVISDALKAEERAPGDIIITQGEEGKIFYLVESGVVEIYKNDALVMTATEAMSFGELALMYNAPRAATVKAVQPTKLYALDRMTFKMVLMDSTIKRRTLYTGFIQQVPILESLNEYERMTVADALEAKEFKDGEMVIAQGEAGNEFFIIESGEAVCYKGAEGSTSAEQREIGVLTSGMYFGEIALLSQRPRQATVKARGVLRCLALDRKTFKRVMGPLDDILKRNMETYNETMMAQM